MNNYSEVAYQEVMKENEKLKADVAMLRTVAESVIARWDTPLWKDAPATAIFINELRWAADKSASSGAWLKEQKAKVLEEAAQWFDAQEYVAMSDDMSSIEDYAENQLRRMAAELRKE